MFGEELVEALREHKGGSVASICNWTGTPFLWDYWTHFGLSPKALDIQQELDCLVFEGKLGSTNDRFYWVRTMITDEELLEYIQAHPNASVRAICVRFSLPQRAENGYQYSTEAKDLRNQLQRLRRTGKIKTGDMGQRWIVST